jgi:hypothetical protein
VNMNIAPSGGLFINNVSAQVESFSTYHPAALNLDSLIPHDHLVIRTSAEPAPETPRRYELPRLVTSTGT